MALSLQDIMAAPTDPDLLNQHLQGLGLLQRPEEVAPTIPPATVGPMTPPKSDVAAMTPPTSFPVEKSAGHELTGLNRELALGATAQPNMPAHHIEPLSTPEIGGGDATALENKIGITPMVTPTLTHSEKMALPTSSPGAPIGSAAETESELARIQEKKEHPWGSPDNHPGVLGKIGHVAGRIGNIALDTLAPGLALNIPGSDLQKRGEENQLKRELATRTAAEGQAGNLKSEEAARDVQTAEGKQRLAKMQNEQNLERDTEGNVTGWKDAQGKLHGLDEEGTPQGVKDIAEATQNKPHFEKSANGDIVQITPGKNGAAATSNVVYKGQPNQKTETRSIVDPATGKAHDQVIDITPGSPTFGKSLADLGRSKEDKTESPTAALTKMKSDEEPVIGYDKDGVMQLMPRGEAKEASLSHIIKATPKDREDAQQNTSVLNDMGAKVRNLSSSNKALDQGFYERGLIKTALAGGPNDLTTAGAIKLMSDKSKAYVQDVFSLREAALALPKQLTGGSRVSEVQAQALWNTIPGVGGDSKYAEKQLRKFDENLSRLWKKVPRVEGNKPERAFPEGEAGPGGGGGGATATPGGPPREPRPGFKWQQNKKTGEYREAPVTQ
jgi:hypothetical protein